MDIKELREMVVSLLTRKQCMHEDSLWQHIQLATPDFSSEERNAALYQILIPLIKSGNVRITSGSGYDFYNWDGKS